MQKSGCIFHCLDGREKWIEIKDKIELIIGLAKVKVLEK